MNIRRTLTTVLLTATAGLALAGCSTAVQGTAVPVAEMTVTGTLTLHKNTGTYGSPGITVDTTSNGMQCAGTGGFSDIRTGAPVTIYDATGTIVGVGGLAVGTPTGINSTQGVVSYVTGCDFPFTVAHVPTGSTFYQYEISHRGKLTFQPADAQSLAADLNSN